MKKNLRKNKKGFTLVEIIVVLLIIGILLAITIPSIMGYVGKAKEAQLEAEARAGYVAAQTITAREVAKDSTLDATALSGKITKTTVVEELNEAAGSESVSKAGCTFTGQKITKCGFELASKTGTYVIFTAQTKDKGADTEVTTKLPAELNGKGDFPVGS